MAYIFYKQTMWTTCAKECQNCKYLARILNQNVTCTLLRQYEYYYNNKLGKHN